MTSCVVQVATHWSLYWKVGKIGGVGDLAQVELLQELPFLEVVLLGVEDFHHIERRPAAGRDQLGEVRLRAAGDELDLAAHRFHLGDDLVLEVLLPGASPCRHSQSDAVELGLRGRSAGPKSRSGRGRRRAPPVAYNSRIVHDACSAFLHGSFILRCNGPVRRQHPQPNPRREGLQVPTPVRTRPCAPVLDPLPIRIAASNITRLREAGGRAPRRLPPPAARAQQLVEPHHPLHEQEQDEAGVDDHAARGQHARIEVVLHGEEDLHRVGDESRSGEED